MRNSHHQQLLKMRGMLRRALGKDGIGAKRLGLYVNDFLGFEILVFLLTLMMESSHASQSSQQAPFVRSLSSYIYKCPCLCDLDDVNRKRIICDEGGQDFIPTQSMDKETQVKKILIYK